MLWTKLRKVSDRSATWEETMEGKLWYQNTMVRSALTEDRSEQRLETSQGVCLVEMWRKIIPRRGIKQRSNRMQYAHHVPGAEGQWG